MSQFSTAGGSGNIEIQEAGVKVSFRPKINFVTGATVTDDPTNNRANVSVSGIGGSVNLDGGVANDVYLNTQGIEGGGASSVYLASQIMDCGAA